MTFLEPSVLGRAHCTAWVSQLLWKGNLCAVFEKYSHVHYFFRYSSYCSCFPFYSFIWFVCPSLATVLPIEMRMFPFCLLAIWKAIIADLNIFNWMLTVRKWWNWLWSLLPVDCLSCERNFLCGHRVSGGSRSVESPQSTIGLTRDIDTNRETACAQGSKIIMNDASLHLYI